MKGQSSLPDFVRFGSEADHSRTSAYGQEPSVVSAPAIDLTLQRVGHDTGGEHVTSADAADQSRLAREPDTITQMMQRLDASAVCADEVRDFEFL